MGVLPGLKAFVAAVLGGIGNIPGAVVGGLLIGRRPRRWSSATCRSTYRDAIAFVDPDLRAAGQARPVCSAAPRSEKV